MMESSSSSPTLRFIRGGYDCWRSQHLKGGWSCAQEQQAGATVDCSLTHPAHQAQPQLNQVLPTTAPLVSPLVRTVLVGATAASSEVVPAVNMNSIGVIRPIRLRKQRDTEEEEAEEVNGKQFDADHYKVETKEAEEEEEDGNACRMSAFQSLCDTEDCSNSSNTGTNNGDVATALVFSSAKDNRQHDASSSGAPCRGNKYITSEDKWAPTQIKKDFEQEEEPTYEESATEKPSLRYYASPGTPTITIASAPSLLTTTPPTTSGACNGGCPLSSATPIQTAATTPTCSSVTSTTLGSGGSGVVGNTTPRNTRIGSQFCPPQFDHDDNGKRAMRPTTSAAALIEQLNSSLSSSRGGGGSRARSRRGSVASVGGGESNGAANKKNAITTPTNVARVPNTAPNTPRSSMGSQPQLVEEVPATAVRRNRTFGWSGKESCHRSPTASLSHSYTCRSRANSSLGNSTSGVLSSEGTFPNQPVRLFGAGSGGAMGLTTPLTATLSGGTPSSTTAAAVAKGGAIRSRRSSSVSLTPSNNSRRNANHPTATTTTTIRDTNTASVTNNNNNSNNNESVHSTTSATDFDNYTTCVSLEKGDATDTSAFDRSSYSRVLGRTTADGGGGLLLSTCPSTVTNTPTTTSTRCCTSGEAVEGMRRRASSYCGVGVGGRGGGEGRGHVFEGGGGGGEAQHLIAVPAAATAIHHQHQNSNNSQDPSAVRYQRSVPGSLLVLGGNHPNYFCVDEKSNNNYPYYTLDAGTYSNAVGAFIVNDFWSHGKGVISPPREELIEKDDENKNTKHNLVPRSPSPHQRKLSAVTNDLDTDMIFSAAVTTPQCDRSQAIINTDSQKATPPPQQQEEQQRATTCPTASAQRNNVGGGVGVQNGFFGAPFERSPLPQSPSPQMRSPPLDEKICEAPQPRDASDIKTMPVGVQSAALASIPTSVSQQMKHNSDTAVALVAAAAAAARTAVCGDHRHADAKTEEGDLPRMSNNEGSAALPLAPPALACIMTSTSAEEEEEGDNNDATSDQKERHISITQLQPLSPTKKETYTSAAGGANYTHIGKSHLPPTTAVAPPQAQAKMSPPAAVVRRVGQQPNWTPPNGGAVAQSLTPTIKAIKGEGKGRNIFSASSISRRKINPSPDRATLLPQANTKIGGAKDSAAASTPDGSSENRKESPKRISRSGSSTTMSWRASNPQTQQKTAKNTRTTRSSSSSLRRQSGGVERTDVGEGKERERMAASAATTKYRTATSPAARSSPAAQGKEKQHRQRQVEGLPFVVVFSTSRTSLLGTSKQRRSSSEPSSSSSTTTTTVERDRHRTIPTDTIASKKKERRPSKGFASSSSSFSAAAITALSSSQFSCPTQRSCSAPAATSTLSNRSFAGNAMETFPTKSLLSPLSVPPSSRGVEESPCGVYRCPTCFGVKLFVPRQSAVPPPPPHLNISRQDRENREVVELRVSPSRSKERTTQTVRSSSSGGGGGGRRSSCTCSTATATTRRKAAVAAIPENTSKSPTIGAPPFLASLSPRVSPPPTPKAAARAKEAQHDENLVSGRSCYIQRSPRELRDRHNDENARFLGLRTPTDNETNSSAACKKNSPSEFLSPPLSNASTPQQRNERNDPPPCLSSALPFTTGVAEFSSSSGDGNRAKAAGRRQSTNSISPNVGNTPSHAPPDADEDGDTRRRARDGAADAEGNRFEQQGACRGRRTSTNTTTARQEGIDRSPQDSLRSHLKKAVRAAEELKRIASASAAVSSQRHHEGRSENDKKGEEKEKSLPGTAARSSAERDDQGVNVDKGENDEDAFVELTRENEMLLARLVRLLS